MLFDKKVVLIYENTLARDTRITKIIKTLKENEYSVTFLGWNRGFDPKRSEISEAGAFDGQVLLNLRAQWGAAVYLTLPIWWLFVFIKLMLIDWDIAHAVQITSAFPAVFAGKIKRKPVIYDMLDVYEDSISIPAKIRNVLLLIDKFIMKSATSIILADKEEEQEIGGIPNSNVIVIYDSPSTIERIDAKYKPNSEFTLFFAGLLIRKKALNLDKIVKAIESIDGVKIVIAGYGDLVDEIEEWGRLMPEKLEFIGEISHAEVLERSIKADALFILRDPIVRVNKYICGSKVLEAMMCGRPIIVNKGTSTSKIVLEERSGIVVDAHNIDEIRNAIITLKEDRDLCNRLGDNGRHAYEMRYSWSIMERHLLKLYKSIN